MSNNDYALTHYRALYRVGPGGYVRACTRTGWIIDSDGEYVEPGWAGPVRTTPEDAERDIAMDVLENER